jgi:alkyl sulfatase BDS1-like metallo-beta-lactamase superfamily hydrolase
MDVLAVSERLWNGEASTADIHPVTTVATLAEVADRTAFVAAFGNVSAFATDGGLLMVDTGNAFLATRLHEQVRAWQTAPLHTAVFSHGHIDHVFGVGPFEEEAAAAGWAAPRVVAHEAMADRFDRYRLTAGYNQTINRRQFGLDGLMWPLDYRYPDETYRDTTTLDVGGETFELHHARGETDDHTWTWVPGRKVLCCGDLFIWASPNAGNPQKVQRYPSEWAAALRTMADLGAELLLPGHGFPVIGVDRIRQALSETAELLESLVDQTLTMMNEGARLDDIVHSVAAPAHLLERPYLRPVYDDPEFVVRTIWRQYGGWWDGNPATLKPAPEAALAVEVAALTGGARRLADRARELAAAGELRLAAHLAELACLADPDNAALHAVRADVYEQRVAEEPSTMAKGVFGWAARESRAHTHPH